MFVDAENGGPEKAGPEFAGLEFEGPFRRSKSNGIVDTHAFARPVRTRCLPCGVGVLSVGP